MYKERGENLNYLKFNHLGTQKVNPSSTLVTIESGSELYQRKTAEEQAKRTENKPKTLLQEAHAAPL